MTKYIACKFRPEDGRSYTYHYDGDEPIAPGDVVKVEDARGDGWKRVHVVMVGDEKPHFPTKPILGKIDPDAEILAAQEAAAAGDDPLTDQIAF